MVPVAFTVAILFSFFLTFHIEILTPAWQSDTQSSPILQLQGKEICHCTYFKAGTSLIRGKINSCLGAVVMLTVNYCTGMLAAFLFTL